MKRIGWKTCGCPAQAQNRRAHDDFRVRLNEMLSLAGAGQANIGLKLLFCNRKWKNG